MARKTAMPNPHARSAVALQPGAPDPPAPRRIPRRFYILLALMLLVAGIGLVVRGTEMRLWWLSRQSLDALRQQAALPDSDATIRYVYGKKLYDARKYEESMAAFESAEKALPPNASDLIAERTLAYVGYLYATYGRDTEAASRLKRAQQLNDDDPITHLGLGLYFLKRKQNDYAENQFKIVVHTDAKSAEGWYYLGRTYNFLKSYQPAIDALLESVKLAPANSVVWDELGQAYANNRQFDKAIPAFQKACDLEPDNISYRTSLGSAMSLNAQTQPQYQEAVKVLEECIRQAPEDDTAELQLGSLNLRFHHLPEARIHLHRLLEIAPNVDAGWFKLSQVEQMLGNAAGHEQALRRYRQLSDFNHTLVVLRTKLGADNKNTQLRLDLMRFYTRYGNLVDAISGYEELLQDEPQNATAKAELENARLLYKAAMAKDPKGNYNRLTPPPFNEPWAGSGPTPGDNRGSAKPDERKENRPAP